MKTKLLPTPEDLTLPQIMLRFSTEETAIKYLESIRWENGVVCPHCGNSDQLLFWNLKSNPAKKIRVGIRQCAQCTKQFRVTVGTIFEDSHVPLNIWLVAWYLICGAKKGMSAKQLQRHLGLGSYKTAWFMSHRIRHAMTDPIFEGKLSGIVEVDECYIGTKAKFRGPGAHAEKSCVVALVERSTGTRRTVVLDRVTAKGLHKAVQDHVEAGSTVNTDESRPYINLPKEFVHKSVRHAKLRGKREYHRIEADGEVVTTNYAESSFSLLRRGIAGNFHHISKKHLPKYVAEFDFRWNHRKVSDGERTVAGLKKVEGKRLTYKPLAEQK